MFPGAFNMPPDISWRVLRVQLAEMFGWTFDVIDTLDLADLGDILGYRDEKGRVEQAQRDRNTRLSKK